MAASNKFYKQLEKKLVAFACSKDETTQNHLSVTTLLYIVFRDARTINFIACCINDT